MSDNRETAEATLRDLVMTSSPMPRQSQVFAAPGAPAIHRSGVADSRSSNFIAGNAPNVSNNTTLIPCGAANSHVSEGGSTIRGKDTASREGDVIVVPSKHFSAFMSALKRMETLDRKVPLSGNYQTGGSQALVENPGGFVPTDMARYGRGHQRPATKGDQFLAKVTGMSPNYRGDIRNVNNHSAIWLPNHLNTAFWIEDLPPDVVPFEILDGIHNCGRVYAVHITTERIHEIGYAAAKIVFMDLEGARRFYHRYVRQQRLVVGGVRAFVVRNRIKVAEQKGLARYFSRCLLINGIWTIVNLDFLAAYFDPLIKYQIDCTVQHFNPNPGMATLEIRFASFRAQAQMAYKILTEDPFFVDNGVTVAFARDPCDRQF